MKKALIKPGTCSHSIIGKNMSRSIRLKITLIALSAGFLLTPTPASADAILGDVRQGFQFYTQFCADKKNQEGGKCTLYKVAAHQGWIYFVFGGEEWSGSGAAKLEKGKWKVLTAGGGALGESIKDYGCPPAIAKRLIQEILAYETPSE